MLFLIIISLILSWTPLAYSCEKEKITIAWDPYIPYQIGDENTTEPNGIIPDMFRSAAEKISCLPNIRYEYIPWDKALFELEKGSVDLIGNAAKTPEREKYAYFKRYFAQSGNAIFINAKNYSAWNKLSLQKLLQLNQFKIFYTNAYEYGDIFKKMKNKYPKKFEASSSDDLTIIKASKEKNTAFVGDIILIRELLKNMKEKQKILKDTDFEPLNIDLSTKKIHAFFMYSKLSMPKVLVDKFDQAMYELYVEKKTRRIFLKYMPESDVNFYLLKPDYEK